VSGFEIMTRRVARALVLVVSCDACVKTIRSGTMKKSTALLHMLTLSVSWSCSGGGASKDGPTQSDGTGGGGGDEHSTCAGPEPRPLSLSNPGRVDMPVAIEINGLPAVVGEPGLGRGGGEWRLSLFKFFIADPFLVGDDDTLHPAELVTVDGDRKSVV